MRIGAGRWKNALLPAAGPAVRPVPGRLRTSLFSVLCPRLEGASVLDLCAGVGALGLEALSRGAARVVLVDRDRRAVDALSRWAAERGVTREALAVVADARRGGWPRGPYDIVFLDPPYDLWDVASDASSVLEQAVASTAPEGVIVVKGPAARRLPEAPRWQTLTRRAQGTVSYTLLVPAPGRSAPPEGSPAGGASEGQEGHPPGRLK